MATEANRRAVSKYIKETVDQILIKPHKDEGKAIREAAASAGQPLQAYILDAVRERMERDEQKSREWYDHVDMPDPKLPGSSSNGQK